MRVKYLTLWPDMLVDMFKGRHVMKAVHNALPDDARLARVGVDPLGFLNLVIESASYPDVREGAVMEQLPAVGLERL